MKLEKVIATLSGISKFNIFDKDIKKDEVNKNSSFFMYNEKGEISRANTGFNRNFYLMFVTKDSTEIDEIEIIKALRPCGLIFDNTEFDYGKIMDTDKEASMTTFVFHYLIRDC